MQGSLARPDFDRLRAGSEFLRRRAPVSRLEPLRYNSTFIYFYFLVDESTSIQRGRELLRTRDAQRNTGDDLVKLPNVFYIFKWESH
jgi:hypothetical protein